MKYKKIKTAIAAFTLAMGFAACDTGTSSDTTNADSTTVSTMPADTMAASNTTPEMQQDTSVAMSTPAETVKNKKKWKASVEMAPMAKSPQYTMDKAGVYKYAEVMPLFPGGQSALDDYINNNIVYPQDAIDNSSEGRVAVIFVVDENGKVTNVHHTGGSARADLEQAAVNVVSAMPAWTPGTVKGKPVKTSMTLPIIFKTEE